MTTPTIAPAARTSALLSLGAPAGAAWHHWATSTVAVDRPGGILYMAMDDDLAGDEWTLLLDLAAKAGYQGDGSPALELDGVTAWVMPISA